MEKYRYVEVTNGGDKWRAVIPAEPMSTKAAEAEAIRNASEAWGIPEDYIEVFVTRTITHNKQIQLVNAAERGTLDPDWWLTNRHDVEVV